MAARRNMHDVIVIGDGGGGREDKERTAAAEAAAEHLDRALTPGASLQVTFKKAGRYQMAAVEHTLDGWLETEPIHVVVSVAFLKYLPKYNLPPLAKDAFWVMVGQLANTDERGRYIHMHSTGEIPITQDQIAELLHVTRWSANGAVQRLMERYFVWKSKKGKYQIHPQILYFGSAEKQAEAIGYAKANRKDGELPPIPYPGREVVLMNSRGVKKIIA